MYTALISGVVFPFHERLKRHSTVGARRALEQSQWWPVDRLEKLRVDRLRRLLTEAGQHVPYYRDLYASIGFDPQRVDSMDALQRLPFLTKPLIRENADRLRHEHGAYLARFTTGGSSGEPLIFFIGRERVSHDVAAKWRATRWWGVDIGDPEIVVWGSPIELGAQDRVRALRDKLLRTQLLPAFEMGEDKLDEFLATIRQRRPKMLFGYPSSLSHIAQHADKRGLRMNDLGIRVAFVTSERLYEHQRATIERIFGCPVANGYGGRDAGFIAHQCPSGGMHITAEDIIVEIVDEHGRTVPPGQSGEIVTTHLATKDFPFIRYRTGDVGVMDDERCSCGRSLPLLKEVQGRSTDFLIAADGTILHGLALIYILRDRAGIKQFKIIQESLRSTRILLVRDENFDANCIPDIQAQGRARLGDGVDIIVEEVAAIAAEKSGKYRYVVSNVVTSTPTENSHA